MILEKKTSEATVLDPLLHEPSNMTTDPPMQVYTMILVE